MKIQIFNDQNELITTVVGCVNPQKEFDDYYQKTYNAAYWREYIEPEPQPSTLLEKQDTKWEEIKAERNRREMAGFLYLGKILDSDTLSAQRISLAAEAARVAKENAQQFVIGWTCQDNSVITMSAEEVVGMPAALAQHSNNLHVIARNLREQIYAAITIEAVEEIAWPTT